MVLEHVFMGSSITKSTKYFIRAEKKFWLPDGTYIALGCDDGGYKYVSVFPQSEFHNADVDPCDIDLGPLELRITNRLIRFPLEFRRHIGAVGDGFSIAMIGRVSYFIVWRNYEFQKFANIGLHHIPSSAPWFSLYYGNTPKELC